ncbi:hypothetical protein KA107_02365 [Candidatus Pacearchaeota archaeon]|nr:hypothetical protein [Candidatus Pacearchaeota archaeon]
MQETLETALNVINTGLHVVEAFAVSTSIAIGAAAAFFIGGSVYTGDKEARRYGFRDGNSLHRCIKEGFTKVDLRDMYKLLRNQITSEEFDTKYPGMSNYFIQKPASKVAN